MRPGRKAVVFGASGGIGRALVKELAANDPDTLVHAGGRSPIQFSQPNVEPFRFDYEEEQSIVCAAETIGDVDLVIVATGILHGDTFGPEKTWRAIDSDAMARVFAVNAIGPALIGKHFLPSLREDGIFAALSARIGSIADNNLGGWHSYRASKAALNMLVRNFAIELRRTNPDAIAVALHPGTVATGLSAPFQRNVPEEQLFSPQQSAHKLLEVIAGLSPRQSGGHFAWDGQRIDP